MNKIIRIIFFLSIFIIPTHIYGSNNLNDMKKNPQRYIEVHDWSFFAASRVGILHHVTIENKSSLEYKDLKIRINYYSTNPVNYGNKISHQQTVLKVILPPNSKKTYLEGGMAIGAGSSQMMAKNLEIISAVVSDN